MNRVLIFAGGKGARMKMNGDIPKQFLEINGKSIIIHTLEKFERNEDIDDIVVVCIKSWISVLEKQIKDFNIKKVSKILAGGETGFDSRMIGINYVFDTKQTEEDVVLIHDGVRPFISNELISENVKMAKEKGNAITVAKATETVVYTDNINSNHILNRDNCSFARAPQTFKVVDIFKLYNAALQENKSDLIDSASIALYFGVELNFVNGPQENIKITTPIDYYAATGILLSKDEELKKYQ